MRWLWMEGANYQTATGSFRDHMGAHPRDASDQRRRDLHDIHRG